jgi:DNA polymerase-3 subunit beta
LKRLCEEARNEVRTAEGEGSPEIVISQNGPNAFFRLAGFQFSVKLVDAQFPPYQQVIPQSTDRTIVAPRAAVIDALKAVSIAASDRTGGVKITTGTNVLRFASESPESGEGFDEVPVEYDAGELMIGFNARYFLDVLAAVDDDEVTIGISGELDPVVLKPRATTEGSSYVAVVMPMRI